MIIIRFDYHIFMYMMLDFATVQVEDSLKLLRRKQWFESRMKSYNRFESSPIQMTAWINTLQRG